MFAEQKVCFLNNLYKNWESFVTLQLPSDGCVALWTNESEKQDTITICTSLPKKEDVPYVETSRDKGRKEKESTYMEMSRTMTEKDAYISNDMQLQNQSSNFVLKNKSLLSATGILSCSPMAYNTTVSLDELTCTN